jgi:hypothetical protein
MKRVVALVSSVSPILFCGFAADEASAMRLFSKECDALLAIGESQFDRISYRRTADHPWLIAFLHCKSGPSSCRRTLMHPRSDTPTVCLPILAVSRLERNGGPGTAPYFISFCAASRFGKVMRVVTKSTETKMFRDLPHQLGAQLHVIKPRQWAGG